MNQAPQPSMQSVTVKGRVLQAPDGAFFSSHTPMMTAALRGLVWGIASAMLTELVLVLQSSASLSDQWKPALALVLGQVLRLVEGYLDQRSVVSP